MDISTIITNDEQLKPDIIIAIGLLKILDYKNRSSDIIIKRYSENYLNNLSKNSDTIIIGLGSKYNPNENLFNLPYYFTDTYNLKSDIPMSHAGIIWKYYGSNIIETICSYNIKLQKYNIIEYIDDLCSLIYYRLIKEVDAYMQEFFLLLSSPNLSASILSQSLFQSSFQSSSQSSFQTFFKHENNLNLCSLLYTINNDQDNQSSQFDKLIDTVKFILNQFISHLVEQYILSLDDINYIRNIISNDINDVDDKNKIYLILDGPCMSLSDTIDFLDPECKYKCFIFVDNPREILIRSRFRNFIPCLKFFKYDELKLLMTCPDDLIYVNDNQDEVKVLNISSAINVIKISSNKTLYNNNNNNNNDNNEFNNLKILLQDKINLENREIQQLQYQLQQLNQELNIKSRDINILQEQKQQYDTILNEKNNTISSLNANLNEKDNIINNLQQQYDKITSSSLNDINMIDSFNRDKEIKKNKKFNMTNSIIVGGLFAASALVGGFFLIPKNYNDN